jgi:hypothetical protein
MASTSSATAVNACVVRSDAIVALRKHGLHPPAIVDPSKIEAEGVMDPVVLNEVIRHAQPRL